MRAKDVTRVGVVGCGLMGSGIVEVAARAGAEVTFVEATEELMREGHRRVEGSIRRAVERGKLDPADAEAALGRIRGETDLKSLADSEVVVEAATEDVEAKIEVFRVLGQVTRPEAVLGSNTSSIPIVDLAIASGRPDKVVGMHFFNPPPVMPLLELTPALTTSEETVAFARAFAERLGKTVVVSKDHAGFIVNRLLIPYLNDAARLYDEGFATREDIDTAIHLGLAHPMGPLTLMDLIGIDTCVNVAEVLVREFGEPKYAAPPILKRMVAAGRLGRKSGRGFYDYG
ncbi:MAG: 3-hydroxybutyryl-CoA dehydrogenase [Actinobacteria bacterium]|nr:3-hydroxybutyryl-CoA dehydrogenase [Actinomycetota bacterium]